MRSDGGTLCTTGEYVAIVCLDEFFCGKIDSIVLRKLRSIDRFFAV